MKNLESKVMAVIVILGVILALSSCAKEADITPAPDTPPSPPKTSTGKNPRDTCLCDWTQQKLVDGNWTLHHLQVGDTALCQAEDDPWVYWMDSTMRVKYFCP